MRACLRSSAASSRRKKPHLDDTKNDMRTPSERTRFAGLELLTSPGRVMTPRPATEKPVGRSVARLGTGPARVADVGSGSGAIAVALALRAPRAEIWAVDVSREAVELARANAALYGVADRVHVVRGDLLDAVPGELDLIVANLPYLPARTLGERRYVDLRSEPVAAVFAPGDGLGPYRRLVCASQERLHDNGALVVQYRGAVFEASRRELPELLSELEEAAGGLSAAGPRARAA
jgi:release factor glutamine methyltransferase